MMHSKLLLACHQKNQPRVPKRPTVIKIHHSPLRPASIAKVATMTLSQRLKQLQQPVADSVLPDLSHLRLEDLRVEKVDFGTKHKGKTYEEAWLDQPWISFMASHYGESKSMSHRKLLRFIEMMVDKHEASGQPIAVSSSHADVPNPQSQRPMDPRASMKAKAKPMANPKSSPIPVEFTHLPEMDDADWELGSQTYQSGFMEEAPLNQDPSFLAMQTRLLHMEDALGRVINHLEGQNRPSNQAAVEDPNAV